MTVPKQNLDDSTFTSYLTSSICRISEFGVCFLIEEENEGLFNNYDVSVMQDKLKLYRSAIQDCESSSHYYIKPLKFNQSRINVQCSLFNNEYPVVKFG